MKAWIAGVFVACAGVMLLTDVYAANFMFLQQNIYTIQTLRLLSTEPLANVALTKPPTTVTLYFSAPVNPNNSQLTVYDPYGNKISSSPSISGTNMSVTVSIPRSGYSGAYSVQWVASCLCSDSNRPGGVFDFSIN